MSKSQLPEDLQLREAVPELGIAYSRWLIEMFGTAEHAIEYLCADYTEQGRMISVAQWEKQQKEAP